MPYIGRNHTSGDNVNNFKVLDDISSYTVTFDGTASSVVNTTNNTIRVPEHRFIQGQRVTYTNGGGGNIGGLTTGTAYFIIADTGNTFKLATSASNATSSTAINLSSVGTGTSHTINASFDGVNTRFKITHGDGVRGDINSATQLNIAINNVVQRPNINSATFTEGFAVEDQHKLVFKTAPTSVDIFWGSIIANNLSTFDISDHKIDTFIGNGSTTEFNLSHVPANNESLMVTINGVLQHPSNTTTSRAYTLIASVLKFTAAPANGDEIQVRHLGFAGATTADVSGFYGRTGNVVLTDQDDITVNKINVGTGVTIESNGQATFVGVVTFGSGSTTIDNNVVNVGTALTLGHTQGLQFHTQNLHSAGFEVNQINTSGIITASSLDISGNASIGGVLTYEDVTSIDSVGIVTAREGIFIPDNKNLRIGSSNDMVLVHDGSHSRIKNTTGTLFLQSDGIKLKNYASTAHYISCVDGGTVELYHNGTKKFETTSSGVDITNVVQIGTSNDQGELRIGHDGSTYRARIVSNSSNSLEIDADGPERILMHGGVIYMKPLNTEKSAAFVANGAVELYHDNVKKFETSSSGATVTGDLTATNDIIITGSGEFYGYDNSKIVLGHGRDLQIYHDGTNSLITNTTADLRIRSNSLKLQSITGEEYLRGTANGSVDLFFDNVSKFNTNADGYRSNDNVKAQFGNSSDLQIYHDGTDSFIDNNNGSLKIHGVGSNGFDVHIQARSDEEGIKLLNNSGESKVELYYNNNKKFETTSSGVTVSGNVGVNVTDPKSKLHLPVNEDVRIGGQYGGTAQVQNEINYSSGYTGVHWMFESNQSVSWCFDGVMIVNGSGSSSYGSEVVKITIVYSREYGALNSGDTWRNGTSSYNFETLGHDQVGLNPSAGTLSVTEQTDPDGAGSTRSLLKLSWSASGQSVGVTSRLMGNLHWSAAATPGGVEIQDKDGNVKWNSHP